MLTDGEVVYRTPNRNVPGTHIQLEFTLRSSGKQYLAVVNAVRDGKMLLRQRLFEHSNPDPIHAWAGTLVDAINKQFGTTFGGLLKHELERLMDTPMVSVPTVPPKAEVVLDPAEPNPFAWKDIWEIDPDALITQPEIITTLTLHREPNGITCLLRVEYENKQCVVPTAFNSVDQIYTWLGEYENGRYVSEYLRLDPSYALALCKRWMDKFAEPLRQCHRRLTPPTPAWLRASSPDRP